MFSGSADFRETEWPRGAEFIEFADVLIENPGTISPEVDGTTSSWPEGWRVRITDDGGTLERG